MSKNSHLWTENETKKNIEEFLVKLNSLSQTNSEEINFLKESHEKYSKDLDENDPDMDKQLKRCARGISRYEKIQAIQKEIQDNLHSAMSKLNEL